MDKDIEQLILRRIEVLYGKKLKNELIEELRKMEEDDIDERKGWIE